eukprot:4693178-Amphidinium_carterae.1
MLVLDFSQAFWQLPIWPGERKYFTTKVGKVYYAYLRVAQGSRAGPLLWARFASFLMRWTLAVWA